ncbi:Fe-S oxidoreductase [Haloarcula sp. CBA1115]|uniref:radical SAM/SPASM domain-containing protein n=1 Tax=unclassified Haloarcula TaxID=2624677 RepID=UPI00059552E7|nr:MULTISPECIES: radical SAM/SPASM domain-containing protein [unclassified Haloarcula]AJF26293.1 Fe-S oxidoreductase [Haloarcula sp. CBA1115]KAA9407891.1 radical SAM/SPASM domain-containing protein [Haloarcula sp. CBA1131]
MRGKLDLDEQPLVLIWEVTQACELACKHCRADAQPRRHPDELSTAEGKALLDQARDFGDGQLVVLSGGDPLAREDLPELIDYGTEQGLRMTLTPSGTNSITRDRLAELDDAGLRRLALSIDGGDSEYHDTFRGESGSFEATMAAAKAARDLDIPLQINTTVCAETVEQLPAIRDLVADLDAVLWSVFFLVPVGRGRVLTPIAPERAERVLSWLHEVSDEAPFGLKTTEAPHYRRVAMQKQDEGASGLKRRMGIRAGKGFAFVSHTGEVFPSGFLPKSAGSIREESVVDIYRDSPLFQQLRDDDALTGKCGACRYRTVCGGSRSRAYATTGDPLAADPLCDYQPDGFEGSVPDQHPAD